MTMNDYRLSHIYRTPIYQKRIINPENYVSSSLFILSSSPNRTAFVTRRHYSTPVISTLRFIEVKSPTSNKVIKLYYPHVGLAHLIRDQSSISDSAKSMSLSTSLVKRRYQEERIAYMTRTPTSICSDADIILPVAKKNRNTIIETSCPIVSDVQSSSQDITTRKLWKERERAMSFDFEDDIPISNKDSLQDGVCSLFFYRKYIKISSFFSIDL